MFGFGGFLVSIKATTPVSSFSCMDDMLLFFRSSQCILLLRTSENF